MSVDRMTRVTAELFEAAAIEGRRENRSARQQLEHWTRLGRELSAHETATRRAIAAAVCGEMSLSELEPLQRYAANVEIDVAIRERAAATSFGQDLLDRGLNAVVLDERGELVELLPHGVSRPIDATWQPHRTPPMRTTDER